MGPRPKCNLSTMTPQHLQLPQQRVRVTRGMFAIDQHPIEGRTPKDIGAIWIRHAGHDPDLHLPDLQSMFEPVRRHLFAHSVTLGRGPNPKAPR